jgi:hypothetical protein
MAAPGGSRAVMIGRERLRSLLPATVAHERLRRNRGVPEETGRLLTANDSEQGRGVSCAAQSHCGNAERPKTAFKTHESLRKWRPKRSFETSSKW